MNSVRLADFNPTDHSFYSRSHDWYPALLEQRVYQHVAAAWPSYSLFRWEDVEPALRDWETFSNVPRPGFEVFVGGEADFVGLTDPPAQIRLRALMGKAMSPTWLKSLEPTLRALAEEVIDEAIEREEVNFFRDVAQEFIGRFIIHMHGLPRDNLDYYLSTSSKLVGAFGFGNYLPADDPVIQEKIAMVIETGAEFMNHIRSYVEERKRSPKDDLISRLVSVEAGGERLTDKEVTIMARDLNLGALDTTACTAAALALRLQQNPDQCQRLREQPDMLSAACDEALRFDSAARQAFRRTTRPVELHGQTIPEGADVGLWISAANVDPAANPEPLRFDITRQRRKLVTFSAGPHHCPGFRLANLEMNVLWSTLLAKTSAIEVEESSIEWYPSPHVHGPIEIRTRFIGR